MSQQTDNIQDVPQGEIDDEAAALLADIEKLRQDVAETDRKIADVDHRLDEEVALFNETEKKLAEDSLKIVDEMDQNLLTFVANIDDEDIE